jgi:hypothetical protein
MFEALCKSKLAKVQGSNMGGESVHFTKRIRSKKFGDL